MKMKDLICPVCGKHKFGASHDYEICRYCGWENDGFFEAGGANEISLREFRTRYQFYLLMNRDYLWRTDGFPEITEKDMKALVERYEQPGDFTRPLFGPSLLSEAESALDVSLPKQYVAFLHAFGHGGINGVEVLGIRWHLQAGNICIPGSSNEQHIKENYDVWGFELTEEEMVQMTALERDERFANY